MPFQIKLAFPSERALFEKYVNTTDMNKKKLLQTFHIRRTFRLLKTRY